MRAGALLRGPAQRPLPCSSGGAADAGTVLDGAELQSLLLRAGGAYPVGAARRARREKELPGMGGMRLDVGGCLGFGKADKVGASAAMSQRSRPLGHNMPRSSENLADSSATWPWVKSPYPQ